MKLSKFLAHRTWVGLSDPRFPPSVFRGPSEHRKVTSMAARYVKTWESIDVSADACVLSCRRSPHALRKLYSDAAALLLELLDFRSVPDAGERIFAGILRVFQSNASSGLRNSTQQHQAGSEEDVRHFDFPLMLLAEVRQPPGMLP